LFTNVLSSSIAVKTMWVKLSPYSCYGGALMRFAVIVTDLDWEISETAFMGKTVDDWKEERC